MRMRIITAAVVLVIGVLAYVAWRRSAEPAAPAGDTPAGEGVMSGGEMVPEGGMIAPPPQDPGMAWVRPGRWVDEPASGMRLATYVVPSASSGSEAAKCAVYYFGPGQGGGTDANIERWIGEFEDPSKPDRRDFSVGDIKVARVELSGTYLAHAGGTEAAPAGAAGWTLLAAIVEGPEGAVFFKLAGPSATVGPAEKEFDAMLASLKRK